MLHDFHFLRPMWLFALALILIVCALLHRHTKSTKQWSSLIDTDLLNHLIKADTQRISPLPIILIALGGLIAVLALAGPSWQKLPQPQFVNQQPLVLLVDMSPSMAVQDIKPSRLVKLRFKLIDLLKERKEGLTALLVYAGDAHVLAPLSEDNETLLSLVPTLSPQVMPVSGSNTEEGVALAISLLKAQSYNKANIILLTDGMTPQAAQNVSRQLAATQYQLSILGVGTAQGAPIPLANQGFAKDAQGNIVLPKLDAQLLQKVAHDNAGIYQSLSLSNQDVIALLAHESGLSDQYQALEKSNSLGDKWQDAGQWLSLLLLPLALLGFRKGWVLQLVGVSIIAPFLFPVPAQAFEWQDLWKTANQQGAIAFENEDYAQAADKFKNESWKGAAQYKAGDFSASAESFSTQENADGYYNQGNAQAHSGKLKEAIASFDKAIELEPNMADAQANKKLLKDFLEQQKQQQDQQQSSEGDSSKESERDQNQSEKNQSSDKSDSKNSSQSEQEKSQGEQASDSKSEKDSTQKEQDANSKESAEAGEDKKASEQLEQLKSEQQQKEQQALDNLNQQKDPKNTEESAPEIEQAVQEAPQKSREQQQLENWLGQLPEDASRLVRNKFNYEYQKKRQAYINGQWQPPKEQRW